MNRFIYREKPDPFRVLFLNLLEMESQSLYHSVTDFFFSLHIMFWGLIHADKMNYPVLIFFLF